MKSKINKAIDGTLCIVFITWGVIFISKGIESNDIAGVLIFSVIGILSVFASMIYLLFMIDGIITALRREK